jgi:hypothetical protein
MPTQANTQARLAPTTTPALDDVPQVSNVIQFATVWGQGGAGGGVAEAPQDGTSYVRRNLAWTNLLDMGTY